MAWPYQGPLSWFDEIRISFEMAASAANAAFLPTGEAWRSALRVDPSIQLYGSDGFHPTPTGTFLAALEIYERITGHDARALPPKAFSNGLPLVLPEAVVRLLQEAAHDANTRYPGSVKSAAAAVKTASASGC